jgi:ABC-type multidrug transport system fused ATPase/permease subunit
VESGKVSIGGINVKDFTLSELRKNIGLVSQDPFLFDSTIKENLLLAAPLSTDLEITEALKTAQAWDFVSRLPLALNTLIGERGVRLSMGEKQRLTLARAILKSPPIVILDEATSSVDVETERHIQIALNQLIQKRTTLIIAHRLSTIREADQIIFLNKGEIVEQGTHKELILKDGSYANFCKHQENLLV